MVHNRKNKFVNSNKFKKYKLNQKKKNFNNKFQNHMKIIQTLKLIIKTFKLVNSFSITKIIKIPKNHKLNLSIVINQTQITKI